MMKTKLVEMDAERENYSNKFTKSKYLYLLFLTS